MIRRITTSLLTLLMAFWSPVWCCCAASATVVTVRSSSEATCSHCVTASGPTDVQPAGSPVSDHDCPHAPQRIMATLDKAPHWTAAFPLPLCTLPTAALVLPVPHAAFVSHEDADHLLRPDLTSLVSLRCQLTI